MASAYDDRQIIEADLTWLDSRLVPDVRVQVDAAGQIVAVGAIDAQPTLRLQGEALLPGFVNAHSHAFQRGLRGFGERFEQGVGSFWSWREAMYDLVGSITVQRMYELSRQSFEEMLRAGITTVGEFHYLHHEAGRDDFALDEQVVRAAADSGIRLVLLQTYYNTGAIGQSLQGGQRQFGCDSVERFERQLGVLHDRLDVRTQSLGVVAHSIRAASLDDIKRLHDLARQRSMVMHMHVEEQQQEIEQCVAAYSQPPTALLNQRLGLDGGFTSVHCTHTDSHNMQAFAQAGANVCICPLTEANLGDGLADIVQFLASGGNICLGTDSNARISMIEEMRLIEYGQRLTRERRGCCLDASGQWAATVLDMATRNGARSLGVECGAIAPGLCADFATVDLTSPDLAGCPAELLAEAIVCGCDNSVIRRTCVQGSWREHRTGHDRAD